MFVVVFFLFFFDKSTSIRNFFASITNFFSNSDLSVSYLVFKTNPLISILFTFATSLLYTVFSTTSLLTRLLNLLKSTGRAFNLPTSILSILPSKLAKPDFAANLEVSIHVAFFKSAFDV